MELNIPILSQLSGCKNLLIAGMGGGFDVFCGLPIYFELTKRGQSVHLANFSFSDITSLREGVRLSSNLVGIVADQNDIALSNLLQYLSSGYITQKILVSGHMAVQQEYQVVSGKQLRFTSGQHATSRETRRYLLFDAGRPAEGMEDLVAGLYSI